MQRSINNSNSSHISVYQAGNTAKKILENNPLLAGEDIVAVCEGTQLDIKIILLEPTVDLPRELLLLKCLGASRTASPESSDVEATKIKLDLQQIISKKTQLACLYLRRADLFGRYHMLTEALSDFAAALDYDNKLGLTPDLYQLISESEPELILEAILHLSPSKQLSFLCSALNPKTLLGSCMLAGVNLVREKIKLILQSPAIDIEAFILQHPGFKIQIEEFEQQSAYVSAMIDTDEEPNADDLNIVSAGIVAQSHVVSEQSMYSAASAAQVEKVAYDKDSISPNTATTVQFAKPHADIEISNSTASSAARSDELKVETQLHAQASASAAPGRVTGSPLLARASEQRNRPTFFSGEVNPIMAVNFVAGTAAEDVDSKESLCHPYLMKLEGEGEYKKLVLSCLEAYRNVGCISEKILPTFLAALRKVVFDIDELSSSEFDAYFTPGQYESIARFYCDKPDLLIKFLEFALEAERKFLRESDQNYSSMLTKLSLTLSSAYCIDEQLDKTLLHLGYAFEVAPAIPEETDELDNLNLLLGKLINKIISKKRSIKANASDEVRLEIFNSICGFPQHAKIILLTICLQPKFSLGALMLEEKLVASSPLSFKPSRSESFMKRRIVNELEKCKRESIEYVVKSRNSMGK